MIELIVTDIDGTLVNSQKEIPDSFWSVFQDIRSKNIRFCVASGRQMQSLEQLFSPIANEIGFISDNGAFVKFKGEELHHKTLNFKEIQPILTTCDTIENAAVVLCGKNKAYVKTQNQWLFDQIALHYPALERVSDFSSVDDVVFKISVCDKKGSQENSYPYLKKFSDSFNVVVSGAAWLDITEKSINKGVAVKKIQNLWSVSPEKTLVFGDQFNDIEMLQSAKFSYAMKNAPQEVKNIASFVTAYDNNEEGVVSTIKEFLL